MSKIMRALEEEARAVQAPLKVEHLPNDVLLIAGIRYSAELFRSFAFDAPGVWIRINERDERGTVSVRVVGGELAQQFDKLADI